MPPFWDKVIELLFGVIRGSLFAGSADKRCKAENEELAVERELNSCIVSLVMSVFISAANNLRREDDLLTPLILEGVCLFVGVVLHNVSGDV